MPYFFIYLFLEVLVSVNISSKIGGFNTFLEIIVTAFIGIALLINFKGTLMENMRALSFNKIDLFEFQKLNLFSLIGAILLIIPGFLTDILGALLQFSLLTSMIVNRSGVKSDTHNSFYDEKIDKTKDSDVIDVEIISDNTTIK